MSYLGQCNNVDCRHQRQSPSKDLCIKCDNNRARHEAAMREFWKELES